MKLAIILFIARYIHEQREEIVRFSRGIIFPGAVVCLVGILLLAQPDFGSTAVIFLVVLSSYLQLLVLPHLLTAGIIGIGAGALLVYSSPYRMRRLVTFLDPFSDPASSGYQLIQSLVAVGSGGIWGAGLGAGQQKLYYLPAAHTDFILQ